MRVSAAFAWVIGFTAWLASANPGACHTQSGSVGTGGGGALTFTASTGLATPNHGAMFALGTAVPIDSDIQHFVKIVDGMGGGGNVNVDYYMDLGLDGTRLGSAVASPTNGATATLQNGMWILYAGIERVAPQTDGNQHVPDARAWLQFHNNTMSRAYGYHYHTYQ